MKLNKTVDRNKSYKASLKSIGDLEPNLNNAFLAIKGRIVEAMERKKKEILEANKKLSKSLFIHQREIDEINDLK